MREVDHCTSYAKLQKVAVVTPLQPLGVAGRSNGWQVPCEVAAGPQAPITPGSRIVLHRVANHALRGASVSRWVLVDPRRRRYRCLGPNLSTHTTCPKIAATLSQARPAGGHVVVAHIKTAAEWRAMLDDLDAIADRFLERAAAERERKARHATR